MTTPSESPRYRTAVIAGHPCPNVAHHDAEGRSPRSLANGRCVECQREAARRSYPTRQLNAYRRERGLPVERDFAGTYRGTACRLDAAHVDPDGTTERYVSTWGCRACSIARQQRRRDEWVSLHTPGPENRI